MPKLIFKSRFFRHSAMMGSLLLLAPLLGMVIFAQYPETPTTESLSETVTTAPVNNPLAHGGPTLFVSDLGGIDVYDHTNGDYLGKFGDTSGENLLGLVFHPVTGNLLAGHSDGYIAEYDGETGALIGTFGDAADHVFSPFDLVFHPATGNLLLLEEGTSFPTDILPVVQEYDGTTGNYIGDFGATEANLTRFAQQHMAFNPVTGNLLVQDRKDVREFDGTTGAYIGIFGETAANTGTVVDLAIHPGSGNLFVADRSNDDIREFDATTGAYIGSFDGGGTINNPIAIAFAPAGSSGAALRPPTSYVTRSSSGPTVVLFLLYVAQQRSGEGQTITVFDLLIDQALFDISAGRLTSVVYFVIREFLFELFQLSFNNNLQSTTTQDPISTFTGELFEEPVTDLSFGGPLPLIFSRYYASKLKTDGNIRSSLGDNWLHNFDSKLSRNGTDVTVVNNKGRVITFVKNGAVWDLTGKTDVAYQLEESGTDFLLLDPRTGLMNTYNVKGKLIRIGDGHGNAHRLLYSDEGRLTYITDDLGREMFFTYSFEYLEGGGPRKLIKVTDRGPTRTVNFDHTGNDLTSVSDVRGNITTYTYDAGGLMTSSTHPAGNTPFTQTYDANGKVDSQTDSNGNTFSIAYADPNTTITDPLGNTRVHTHTTTGEFSNRQDQTGQSFSMGSDSTGRRNSLTDRLGDTTTLTYHAASGKIASVNHADGTTTSYAYTARAVGGVTLYDLTRITHANGTTESFAYDANGNLISHTDQAGKTLTGAYNANGQPLSATNVAGGVTTYTYNADATLNSTTDPAGNTTSFGYDALKRPNLMTFADASTWAFSYDAENRLLSTTDENGNTTTLTYDANGRLDMITNPLANTTTFAYDGNDRLLSTIDPLGGSVSSTYDQLGRLETITDENGNTVTLGYNTLGRLTAIIDPLGNVSTRSYDLEAIIASSSDPLGNTSMFTSDQMGRITQATSPLGNVSGIAYDAMGRAITITDPLGNITTLSREARGLLSGITLPGGAISTAYTRNALGLITTMTDPNGKNWRRTYDNQGRQTSSSDPLANTRTIGYDNRNRPSTITFPDALGMLTLGYDPAGNLTQAAYSDGTTLNYTYNANHRLTAANGMARTYDANNRMTVSNGIAIGRDAGGRITAMTLAAGKSVTYTYDANDNLTQVSDWAGGITTFTYDAADRLTGITRSNSITTTYTYDNDRWLIGITEGVISTIALTRDGKGQITAATRNITEPLSVTQSGATNLAFDAASQVDSYTYDALGRLTDDGTRTYDWDLASRLTSYTKSGNTVSFTYDALGNRLSRTEGGVTRDFVWNEALGLRSVSIEKMGGADLRYYIHTPGGRLLYSIDGTSIARSFSHFDEMGNTIFVTNDAGTVIGSYAYSPYGEMTASIGGLDNPLTWQGQFGVMTEGDDLYYMRARYYDSATGRFISRDPIKSISPREVNPYQYARGNPLRFVDPLGTEDFDADADFIAGALIDFVTGDIGALIAARTAARVDKTDSDVRAAQEESDRKANILHLKKILGEARKALNTGGSRSRAEQDTRLKDLYEAEAAFREAGGIESVIPLLKGIIVL